MDNRVKFALFFGGIILLFLILLLDESTYSNDEGSGTTKNNTKHMDEIIMLRNVNVSMQDYMDKDEVQAFKNLTGKKFRGQWQFENHGQSQLFDSWSSGGKIIVKFEEDYSFAKREYKGRSPNTTIEVIIVEGEYAEDRRHIIEFTEPVYKTFNLETLEYLIIDKHTNITNVNDLEYEPDIGDNLVLYTDDDNSLECKISITIDLIALREDEQGGVDENIKFPIKVSSSDCNFELKAELIQTDDLERKASYYSVLLTFLAIANLYSIAKLVKQAMDNPTKASQISLLTLGFLLIWDSYIGIAHLFFALDVNQAFQFLMIPTFWYFILVSVFQAKLLVLVWRARYWNRFENPEQGKKALGLFYLKLHSSMIILLYLFYEYILENWFVLLMSLYLVPQIIHSAMQGGRVQYDTNSIFTIVGLRVLLPLYYRGCPKNMLQLEPSYLFCAAEIFIVGLQIGIVYLQSLRGSRFFVPQRFRPAQYNYLVDAPSEDPESGVEVGDCAVCLAPLHQETDTSMALSLDSQVNFNILKPNQKQIMQTPCNHKFHVKCLLECMAVKMECPTCRGALPTIE